MKQREYLDKLLRLCTEKQKAFFARIYPGGPSIKQLGTAISQVERTLSDLNKTKEELSLAEKTIEEERKTTNIIISALRVEVERLEKVEKTKVLEWQELSDEDQVNLQMYHALVAAGVDNWDGYECAQDSVAEWNAV